jgi:hypothetical protein
VDGSDTLAFAGKTAISSMTTTRNELPERRTRLPQSRDVGVASLLPRGGRGRGGQLDRGRQRWSSKLSRPRMVSGVEHGRRSGVLILRGSRGGWLEDDSDIGRGSARSWCGCRGRGGRERYGYRAGVRRGKLHEFWVIVI